MTRHGKRYLDIGCGMGGCLVAFGVAEASEVIGLDVEDRIIELANVNMLERAQSLADTSLALNRRLGAPEPVAMAGARPCAASTKSVSK